VVNGVGVAGYGPKSNQVNYNDLFLPLVGAVYKLDPRTQLFASYAENMAEPKGIDDIFSVTLASSNGVVPAPAPERSQNVEFGIRTRQKELYASLATYYTKYKNRIQSITTFLAGSSGATETYYTNVGRWRLTARSCRAPTSPASCMVWPISTSAPPTTMPARWTM
jgi:iron complex outermembrane receptor protein